MPLREAMFWFGLTVFGTGLFFVMEGSPQRMPWFIAVTAIGFLAAAYSVYRHHYPTTTKKFPVWAFLLVLTWVFIGFDIYDRHHLGFREDRLPIATQIVRRQSFSNDQIEVDGKDFRDCQFTNVSFLYNGTAEWNFVDCKVTGNHSLRTQNAIIKSTLQLLDAVHLIGPSNQGPYPGEPLKPVTSKIFSFVSVILDGSSYVDCTFDNVTFEYRAAILRLFAQKSQVLYG